MSEDADRLLCLLEKETEIRLSQARSDELHQSAASRVLENVLSMAPPILLGLLQKESRKETQEKNPLAGLSDPLGFKGARVEERLKAFALSLSSEQVSKFVEFVFTILRNDQATLFIEMLDVLLPKPKGSWKPSAQKRRPRTRRASKPKKAPPSPPA